jgi:hypothetical protein
MASSQGQPLLTEPLPNSMKLSSATSSFDSMLGLTSRKDQPAYMYMSFASSRKPETWIVVNDDSSACMPSNQARFLTLQV